MVVMSLLSESDALALNAGERPARRETCERTLRAPAGDASGAPDGDAALRGAEPESAGGASAGAGGGVPGHAGEQRPRGIRSGGAEGDRPVLLRPDGQTAACQVRARL